MMEFLLAPGTIWWLLVFVLVCLNLLLKDHLYLTLIAAAAFFAGFVARVYVPFVGQVIVFLAFGSFLLLKGRKPIERWRKRSLDRTKEAFSFAESLEAIVVDPIPSPTLPGRILVDGIVMPARSPRPIARGAQVKITSSGPSEVWVRKVTD